MNQTQNAKTTARPLSAGNVWMREARDRTADLRARLLTGDAEAAQVTRSTFHLLRWEHLGRRIFPLPDDQVNPGRGGDQ
jgi:hypothetical protein